MTLASTLERETAEPDTFFYDLDPTVGHPDDHWDEMFADMTAGFDTARDQRRADAIIDDPWVDDPYQTLFARFRRLFSSRYAPPPVTDTGTLLLVAGDFALIIETELVVTNGPCARCNGDVSRCPMRGLFG